MLTIYRQTKRQMKTTMIHNPSYASIERAYMYVPSKRLSLLLQILCAYKCAMKTIWDS